MSGTNIPMLLLNSWKWYIGSAVVDVGTALVAVRLGVRTGTSPVPTKISTIKDFSNNLFLSV